MKYNENEQEGASYRLGVLSGKLKGYENEEDLYKLAELKNKKKEDSKQRWEFEDEKGRFIL